MPKPSNTAAGRDRPQQAPDYAARRMLASAIVITVLVVGGVVLWRTFGGGDSNSLAAADDDWNRIALVNRTRGTVITIDEDGDAVGEFAGFGRILELHAEGERVALVGPNEIYLGSFDPATASSPTTTATSATPASTTSSVSSTTGAEDSSPPGFTGVAYPRGSTVTRLPIANRLVLAVGQPLGGNALLIDGQSGEVVDIGELAGQAAPLLFLDTIQFDPEGNQFAIADAANFQTNEETTLPEPTVEFFPDAPLAVSDALVVTSQVVGQRADLAFFRHDGSTVRSISMPIPAGAVLTDRGLIVVSEDGDISRVAGDLSNPVGLGSIDQPEGTLVARVDPAGSGARIVVSGDSFQTVIDLDGNIIATATFDIGATIVEPQPGWTCLPLGPSDSLVSLVALDDGSVRADFPALAMIGASADGCTLVGETTNVTSTRTTTSTTGGSTPGTANRPATDTVIVDAAGSVSLGPTRAAALSPDGTTVIRVTRTSDVELVTRDGGALTDPVDLTDLTQPAALGVAFLDES
jgi:hypothetical protein